MRRVRYLVPDRALARTRWWGPTGRVAGVGLVSLVVGGGCLVGALSVLIATSRAIGETPDWSLQQMFPAALNSFDSVTCPEVSDCFIVGGNLQAGSGAVATTTDGGATWRAQDLPSGVGQLFSVTCDSGTHCLAVGVDPSFSNGVVLATTDGGTTWIPQTLPAKTAPLNAVR